MPEEKKQAGGKNARRIEMDCLGNDTEMQLVLCTLPFVFNHAPAGGNGHETGIVRAGQNR